jgi:hypothetical protein
VIALLAAEKLLLESRRCRVFPIHQGIDFLGFVSFPGWRKIRRTSAVRFGRQLSWLLSRVGARELDRERLVSSVRSWESHARFGKTYGLRKKLLAPLGLSPEDFAAGREKGEKVPRA